MRGANVKSENEALGELSPVKKGRIVFNFLEKGYLDTIKKIYILKGINGKYMRMYKDKR